MMNYKQLFDRLFSDCCIKLYGTSEPLFIIMESYKFIGKTVTFNLNKYKLEISNDGILVYKANRIEPSFLFWYSPELYEDYEIKQLLDDYNEYLN